MFKQSHVRTRHNLTIALSATPSISQQSELLWNPLPLRAKAIGHRWQFHHCLPQCTWASSCKHWLMIETYKPQEKKANLAI